MIKVKPFLFLLMMLTCFTTAFGQPRLETKKLEKLFGSIVAATDNVFVFEYNDNHAIRLKFQVKTDSLIKLEVAPKYHFQESNPAWAEEPAFDVALSRSDYEKIIDRAGQLIAIGKLRATSSVAVVTNLKARVVDIYENAVIERSLRDTSKQDIYSAKIWFMRTVSGTVDDETKIEIRPNFFMKKIKMNDCWYWTDHKPVTKGWPISLKVAGPTDDLCVDLTI